MMRSLQVRRIDSIGYADGLALQKTLVEERRAGSVPDLLLLLEHPHVLTLGVKGDGGRGHILATPERLTSERIEIHETGRGGDITYHGPGQIVGYPIIDLKPDRCDVHRYVRDVEEALIRTAGDYGIEAGRIAGLTGVWVGQREAGRHRHPDLPLDHQPRLRVQRHHQPRLLQPHRPVRHRRPRRHVAAETARTPRRPP